MLAALAAATIGMSYDAPMADRPEDTEAKGYALAFSREDRGRFSLFVKDPGKAWEDVPKVEQASESDCGVSWLVFHTILPNVDFIMRTFEKNHRLDAKVQPTDDLTNYFEDDGFVADNNFGLHDIY